MNRTITLSNTDRTSWKRIRMVWNFFLPFTQRKMISFAAIAILFEIIMVLSHDYLSPESSDTVTKMLSTMITVLIACSALVFAKPKGRELQAMLPALGLEKCIVLVGYVTVIIPLIVCVPSTVAYFLLGSKYQALHTLNSLLGSDGVSPWILIYSALFLESMALTGLWAVVASRGKMAMRNGLLAVFGFYMATMVMTAIVSFCMGVYSAFNNFESDFASQSNSLFMFEAIICGIYVIFALIKCCHAIKRGQY